MRRKNARSAPAAAGSRTEIYQCKRRYQRICSALSKIFAAAAVVCMAAALFLVLSAMQLALGHAPLYLMNIDSSVASFLLNITFPTHTALPIDTMDPASLWAVQLGSMGVLLLGWAEITLLLKRTFRKIADGESPFAPRQITRYRIISACVTAMSVCQPALLFVGILLWVFSFCFKYAQSAEREADEALHTQETVILSLADITEQKSSQTGQHVKRVSEYSRILAQKAGLPPEQVENIRIAAMLHDIGKLMIDSAILEKPGKLTGEEFEIIKQHVHYGAALLQNAKGEVMQTARRIALEHHERWNGEGYLHLRGEEISVEGRIVAIADVFDALVSSRSYKKAWSVQDAYEEILSQAGRQFDPQLTQCFAACRPEIEGVFAAYREPE